MLPLLLAIHQPAEAGLGSLVRAAAKLGSSAGKAGGAAAKAGGAAAKAGGVAAKGGGALKGASMLGAAVAAERVFVHMGDDAARMGVYVASSGDEGLRVVMEGGDELAHTTGSFKGFMAELDEMASVTPEAGVDLYVDADALRHLGELELGPNTRLFLANTEGPSWPLRVAADGAPEVGAGRSWFRAEDVALEVLELGVDLSSREIDGGEVRLLVTDPDCGVVPGAMRALSEAAAGDQVVILGAVPDGLVESAQAGGFDVVVPGIDDPCLAGGPPDALAEVLGRISTAATLGELWTVATADGSVVIDGLARDGSLLVVRGVGLFAAHVVAPLAEATDGDPPAWFYGLIGAGGIMVVAYKLRKRAAA